MNTTKKTRRQLKLRYIHGCLYVGVITFLIPILVGSAIISDKPSFIRVFAVFVALATLFFVWDNFIDERKEYKEHIKFLNKRKKTEV